MLFCAFSIVPRIDRISSILFQLPRRQRLDYSLSLSLDSWKESPWWLPAGRKKVAFPFRSLSESLSREFREQRVVTHPAETRNATQRVRLLF